MSDRSDPLTAMFHKNTGVEIKDGKFTDSGRDTNYNMQNNYIIGVFPDVVGYIKNAAQHFVSLTKTNQLSSADDRDRADQTSQSSIPERIPERDPVEITDIVPSDPSSLPVCSIADRYTRSMLECQLGYPLYEPHPFNHRLLSKEYLRNGVNVGDVGFVRDDGSFDFLFNICPPQNAQVNPSNIPDGFSLESPELSEVTQMRPFPCGSCFYPRTVIKTENGAYTCKGSDGAILALPEGAIQNKAVNMGWFEDLAKRNGVEWYKYTMSLGRSISNGSLYLVTSFTKCTQWGIAIFDRPCEPWQAMTFVSNPPDWKGSGALTTRAADPNEDNIPNQCVFLRGYKIMIREDIFNSLPKRQPAHRIRGGGGNDLFSKIRTGINSLSRTKKRTTKSDDVVLVSNFNSPPVHPSDLINSALLSQNLGANIALTHDNVWCDLLRDNFPELDYLKLKNIAQSYTRTIDENGCVSLKKIADVESGHPVQTETPTPVRDFGDEQNREIGDVGNLNSPISTYIANKPHFDNHGDEVVQREVPSESSPQGSLNTNVKIILFGNSRFTEVQRGLIRDYIVKPTTLPDINGDLNKYILPQSIIKLPRANAVFGDYRIKKSSGPCLEGTRVALLREMADWVTGTDESRMCVLSGLAGIGKSTLAYTIASRAADLNLLGASFFFSRDEIDCRNAQKLFTAIAYQLCVYDEKFSRAIGDVLQTRHGSMGIPGRFVEVIVEHLGSIIQTRARPILLVIDALDECDEADRLFVLTELKGLIEALPSFKVILTSRPQPVFDRFVGGLDGRQILYLQNIENKVDDGDIRLYLKHSLLLQHEQGRLLTRQWFAHDDEIDSLVHAARRLFVIASTTVRIVLNKASNNPAVQMQKLLDTLPQDRMPFKDLDEFYTIILRNFVLADCDNDMVNRYKSVVAAIISIQHPLPLTTLAHLININVEEVRAALVKLQSVILLGDDDTPRIYHKSFLDYIVDSKRRCQGFNLHINPAIGDTWIAIRCLRMMEQHLKYNILGLGTPARFMSNKDGLVKDGINDEQLERNIPQQLRYACVYWANRLTIENMGTHVNMMKELERFANEHLLHWFEALSLIGKLDCAHRAIRTVLNALNQRPSEQTLSDLRQLLTDGLQFISGFYETIERSALHVYYSALPFAPTNSLLYRRYIKEANHIVCDIDEKWTRGHLFHGNSVVDMKFSLDGTMLVSLSKEKLKIWDTANGTPISAVSGANFAIANDFSTIASFKSHTITLYDTNGNERGVTLKTPTEIIRVAISSQSPRIAAMLSNKTLLLWDSRSGKLIKSDQDRDRAYDWAWCRLQISATGARLAHSSANSRFLRLRNGVDGSIIADLNCGSVLHQFAFLADDSLIATLSETDLKLWGCEDGKLVGISRNGGKLLVVSANGSLLATGYDNKVALWSRSSGDCLLCIGVVDFHDPIGTMAFAPDDILAVSINCNVKLYDVKTRSFLSTFVIPHSCALALSPDCTCLAANYGGGMVYLWDIQGFDVSSPVSVIQDRGPFTALALSRDCSRIACGFYDGVLELRETSCLAKQPIAIYKHLMRVMTLRWSPDGRRFASSSYDGSINLWDGKSGARCGTVESPRRISESSQMMEVSNTVLAVAGDNGLSLWDLETMGLIRTFEGFFEGHLSFSPDGALLAAVQQVPFDALHLHTASHQTIIFDVASGRIISKFDIASCAMAFLPDSSKLVVQQSTVHEDEVCGIFTFNLEDQKLEQGPGFEEFMQLRNAPLYLGFPVSIRRKKEQYCLEAFYSQQDHHVPVLWIPRGLYVMTTTEGHSMIALGCTNGHLILLRLHTRPLE